MPNKLAQNRLKFRSIAQAQLLSQQNPQNKLHIHQVTKTSTTRHRSSENKLIINQVAKVAKEISSGIRNNLIITQLVKAQVVKAEVVQEFSGSGNHRLIVSIGDQAYLSEWQGPDQLGIIEIENLIYCSAINNQLPCTFVITPLYCHRRKV